MAAEFSTFRILARIVLASFFLTAPSLPLAAEEGKSNTCPWAKENQILVGAHTLDLPQSVFTAKNFPVVIQGFNITPDVPKLKIIIVDPYNDLWEASLTQLSAGKRCTAFYVGEPSLVSSSLLPAAEVAGKPKAH